MLLQEGRHFADGFFCNKLENVRSNNHGCFINAIGENNFYFKI